MIKERFRDYLITYSMKGYWDLYEPVVMELWPVSGSFVETNIKQQFIDHVLGR